MENLAETKTENLRAPLLGVAALAFKEEMNQCAKRIAELRTQENEAGKVKKGITELLEQAESDMIAKLEAIGDTTYKSPYGTATRKYRKSVKTPKTPEQITAFVSYLKSQIEEDGRNLFDHLVETGEIGMGSAKLTSFYNDLFEQAAERGDSDFEIPGLTEVTLTPILSFTKT